MTVILSFIKTLFYIAVDLAIMIKYILLLIVLFAFVSDEIVSPLLAYEESNLCLIDHHLEGESEKENESESEEQLKDGEKLHVNPGFYSGMYYDFSSEGLFNYAASISESLQEKITPPPQSFC